MSSLEAVLVLEKQRSHCIGCSVYDLITISHLLLRKKFKLGIKVGDNA